MTGLAKLIGAAERPRLILHADDFGLNEAINRGICRAFSHGLLTSTSILPNAPGFAPAVRLWGELEEKRAAGTLPGAHWRDELDDPAKPFDLGVHLNLTQGRPLTGRHYPRALLDAQGRFPGIRAIATLLAAGKIVMPGVRRELTAQFERVMATGLNITHVNGHQYVELVPQVRDIVLSLCEQFHIRAVRNACESALRRSTLAASRRPAALARALLVRRFAAGYASALSRSGLHHPDCYFGTAHAGHVRMPVLESFLDAAHGSLIEIGMHPAEMGEAELARTVADGWHDPLSKLRPRELEMLCSSEVFEAIRARGLRLSRMDSCHAISQQGSMPCSKHRLTGQAA